MFSSIVYSSVKVGTPAAMVQVPSVLLLDRCTFIGMPT